MGYDPVLQPSYRVWTSTTVLDDQFIFLIQHTFTCLSSWLPRVTRYPRVTPRHISIEQSTLVVNTIRTPFKQGRQFRRWNLVRMESGMRIPLLTFCQKHRMASILIVGVGKISVLLLLKNSSGQSFYITTVKEGSNLSIYTIRSVRVFWIDSDVVELVSRPSKSLSMKFSEAWLFEFIADNSYPRREVASEFMKPSNWE